MILSKPGLRNHWFHVYEIKIFNGNTWDSHEIYIHAPVRRIFIHGRFIFIQKISGFVEIMFNIKKSFVKKNDMLGNIFLRSNFFSGKILVLKCRLFGIVCLNLGRKSRI